NSHLKGFNIPGLPSRIITSLFADDTTTYLSEFDSFDDLQDILSFWCTASRARFNAEKTEIIPIGSAAYRQAVIQSCRLFPNSPPLPDHVHIAADGKPVRILGAWLGKHVDQANPWSTVIDKISHALTRWNRTHPTFRGKKLIVQMIVGGMSQYLTTVQGMPQQIESTLTKMIRCFIWESDKPPLISLDNLHCPIEEGGIGLLDLRSRNEAIDIMRLQCYLCLTPSRPSWTYLVDTLINDNVINASGHIRCLSQINVFLQSWRTGLNSSSPLPRDLLCMLQAVEWFNINFKTLKLSHSLKKKLPAWYHLGYNATARRLNTSIASDCLRNHHKVSTI
ncbi:hypothetical protein BKA93DRAFT_728944, partial [Sparassis latifolia]